MTEEEKLTADIKSSWETLINDIKSIANIEPNLQNKIELIYTERSPKDLKTASDSNNNIFEKLKLLPAESSPLLTTLISVLTLETLKLLHSKENNETIAQTSLIALKDYENKQEQLFKHIKKTVPADDELNQNNPIVAAFFHLGAKPNVIQALAVIQFPESNTTNEIKLQGLLKTLVLDLLEYYTDDSVAFFQEPTLRKISSHLNIIINCIDKSDVCSNRILLSLNKVQELLQLKPNTQPSFFKEPEQKQEKQSDEYYQTNNGCCQCTIL